MQDREFPIFGRKVFFVNPPLGFDNSIVKKLRDLEYEVYIIQDYLYTKSILREHEESLCFINIDSGLKVNEWFNFIKSFKLDEKLKSVFLGVMSGYSGTGERGKFLMNLQLPGGFINTNVGVEQLFEQIKGILDINGAKGRRQYIRLRCDNISGINGYMIVDNNLFSLDIENISSVGFACSYNKKEMHNFGKNSVHNEVSIGILKKSIVCPSVVFDTRIVNDKGFSVMLFKADVPKSTRAVIKDFIFSVLEDEFVNASKLAIPDYTDYSVDIKLDDTPDYVYNADISIEYDKNEDLGGFDELEDLDEI